MLLEALGGVVIDRFTLEEVRDVEGLVEGFRGNGGVVVEVLEGFP